MYRVFNMGIGLILVVPAPLVQACHGARQVLGDQAYLIGEIVAGQTERPDVGEYVD